MMGELVSELVSVDVMPVALSLFEAKLPMPLSVDVEAELTSSNHVRTEGRVFDVEEPLKSPAFISSALEIRAEVGSKAGKVVLFSLSSAL